MRSLRFSSWFVLFAITVVFQSVAPPAALGQITVPVVVPGWSDPYLAGMPPGSTSCGDTAPAQSPPEVADPCLIAGDPLTFQATGGVARDPNYPLNPPDGDSDDYMTWHLTGAENGISDMRAPFECLVGVFLDESQPDSSPAPPRLDFGTPESRDYLTLSPLLKQVFFIGDGLASGGEVQQVLIPAGATRLYLGTWDGCWWDNNIGQFDVLVTDPCGSTPTGACCFVDGNCTVLTAAYCEGQGGTYQGDFTSCNPNPCEDNRTGACCLDMNGSCVILRQADCYIQGGNYQGPNVPCDPNPCPIVPSESGSWGRIKANYR